MSNNQEDWKWAAVASRLALSTICHPLEYGKTLIQLGHEPISPVPSRRLFGKPAMALPGIVTYVKHIRKIDGLSGCYKGVGLRICALAVQSFAQTQTLETLEADSDSDRDSKSDAELSPEEKWKRFKKTTTNEVTARVVATVVSHPIHVCVVRCMAQFVGRETQYSGLVSCIRETYNESGIAGFFSGIVPRVLAEVLQLLIASTLTYYVNTYLIKEEDNHHFTVLGMNSSNPVPPYQKEKLKILYEASHLAGQFIASTVTYPFLLVSNCMIVSGCGLAAGRPPNMPIYKSWTHCFNHLYSIQKLQRGSSLLFRYA